MKAINPLEFEASFEKVGFEVLEKFGDYGLGPYQALKSERLIYLLKRP